jgi:hypothetical protein
MPGERSAATLQHRTFFSCGCAVFDKNVTQERCGASSRVQHHLLNRPAVFALGLSWPSAHTPVADISALLSVVSERLDLAQVYVSAAQPAVYRYDATAAATSLAHRWLVYRLRALVRYYGFHYDSVIRDEVSGQWVIANDRFIHEVCVSCFVCLFAVVLTVVAGRSCAAGRPRADGADPRPGLAAVLRTVSRRCSCGGRCGCCLATARRSYRESRADRRSGWVRPWAGTGEPGMGAAGGPACPHARRAGIRRRAAGATAAGRG